MNLELSLRMQQMLDLRLKSKYELLVCSLAESFRKGKSPICHLKDVRQSSSSHSRLCELSSSDDISAI